MNLCYIFIHDPKEKQLRFVWDIHRHPFSSKSNNSLRTFKGDVHTVCQKANNENKAIRTKYMLILGCLPLKHHDLPTIKKPLQFFPTLKSATRTPNDHKIKIQRCRIQTYIATQLGATFISKHMGVDQKQMPADHPF